MILWERATEGVTPLPRSHLAFDKVIVGWEIVKRAVLVRDGETAFRPVTVDCCLDP
jgi:hypothetical protein